MENISDIKLITDFFLLHKIVIDKHFFKIYI